MQGTTKEDYWAGSLRSTRGASGSGAGWSACAGPKDIPTARSASELNTTGAKMFCELGAVSPD